MPIVSVILPTFNEIRHGMLERILINLPVCDWLEVIVIDSGSGDGTIEIIKKYSTVRLIQVAPCNRAQRIKAGVRVANGEIIFLHHPRSVPDPAAFQWLKTHASSVTWGALTQNFEMKHPLLKFTSWYSNHGRGKFQKIYYLDHCLFVNKRFWQEDRMTEADIFEDTLWCLYLRKQALPMRLPFKSMTSAVRFKQSGFIRQAVINQFAKMAFWAGVPTQAINKFYERGLHFNDFARPKGDKVVSKPKGNE